MSDLTQQASDSKQHDGFIFDAQGQAIAVQANGKRYEMTPIDVDDHMAARKHYAKLRSPLAAIADTLPTLSPELQAIAVTEAIRQSAAFTDEEFDRWRDSTDGRVFMFGLSLRAKHPQLTKNDADKIFQAVARGEGEKHRQDINRMIEKYSLTMPDAESAWLAIQKLRMARRCTTEEAERLWAKERK